MTEALQIPPLQLERIVARIFEKGGSRPEEAEVVAVHLVLANLSGHDSHGVGMIPAYVRNLGMGLLVPNQEPEVVQEGGPILVLDGRRGFGQWIGRRAMELAIELCREHGVVLMTLRNTHHLGRIGTYGEQAIAAGLCSIHFVNVVDHRPYVAPFRGSDGRFQTNPICLAMPGTENQPPILLDMATSRIAAGKVRVAFNTGVEVPEGSLIDNQGQPTRDPGVLAEDPPGSLLPFGEHKGYGLALFGELFGGMLSGGGTVQPGNPRQGSIINNMLTVLIDPQRLVESEWMAHEIEALVDHVKASPPVDPEEPVLVPGDPERLSRQERAAAVPVDPATWEQILQAAETLGLARSEIDFDPGVASID